MANDCQKVQGFLFGRPTPARDLAAIIAKDMRNAIESELELPRSSSTAA
jgi:hypothetical protein